MNIIKLKDIIKPNDDLFNEHLKGRYAYWIQMRYIVSFDHMEHEGYVACEMNIDKLLKKEDGTYPKPFGCPYIDTYGDCDIYNYIDDTETDRINSISEFKIINQFQPDADITIDELKKFRTWLATQLLIFDQNNTGDQLYIRYDLNTTNMLLYYKNGMIDNVIERLTEMSIYKDNITIPNTCCCCGTTGTLEGLYEQVNSCDPIPTYRHYIYNKMVQTYSDLDFWLQFPAEFISDFKKYIDNIIKMNLKLYKTPYISDFVDCGGLSQQELEQNKYKYILEKLSTSLNYIINNDINGHKNFIGDALNEWSSILYENMEW